MLEINLLLTLFFLHIIASHAQKTNKFPCIPIRNCSHINTLKNTKRDHYGTIAILNLLHCKPKNEEIYIQCMDEKKVQAFMDRAEVLPNFDYCGVEYPENKISGGENTRLDDYPWIALLQYKIGKSLEIACHGSLISKRYVLTAAHCVDPILTKALTGGNLYSVVLGDYDITSEIDCYGDDCVEENKKVVLVESFEMHPEFNRTTYLNDIALIRLNIEVDYTDFIKPICLPPKHLITPFNETLFIAGWGKTDRDKKNKVKVKAKFELLEVHRCRATIRLTSRQFCASPINTSDKNCPGDSGGPLMMRRTVQDNSILFLIGIDSLGVECILRSSSYTIYTQVAPYADWLLETIRK